MKRNRIILIGSIVSILLVSLTVYAAQRPGLRTSIDQPPAENSQEDDTQHPPPPAFDKDKLSLTDTASIWVVVNKQRPLPSGYIPNDLTTPNIRLRLGKNDQQMKLSAPSARALERLFTDALAENLQLVLSSGYRSEALQKQFYNNYASRDGQEAADRYSARPGTSEHQTSFAADLTDTADKCHLAVCFGDQPEGKWLAANAHRYGFIIRYPESKETVTGYQYEPWHLRYVGEDLATEMYTAKVKTLEEFFGLPAAPDY